jgi:translation initiation factor 1
MSKKNKPDSRGFVYSTNPNFSFESANGPIETLPPAQQKLRLWLETKHRGGKAATVITGFVGTEADMEALSKQLKNYCGTGGSAKDDEIIIQGDQRDKVLQWLLKNGYTQAKKAGG